MPTLADDRDPTWWGDLEIPQGRAGHWRIGPLGLWIENRSSEWCLAHAVDRDEDGNGVEIECPRDPEEPPAGATLVRVASGREETALRLAPALGDRSIVARPEIPFRLRSQADVALYLSTPLWVTVESTEPSGTILDVPTRRPNDTWFGPSTLGGELCYAVRTRARLNFENVTVKPDRGITKVVLQNHASDNLLLERLNLPVQGLSLFVDGHGHLWTEEVTVTKKQDGKLAEIHFGSGPPAEAGECTQVAGPRAHEHRNVLVRALGALLG